MATYTKNEKLEETITYVTGLHVSSQLFGKIKLNKILFFADANAFARLGSSITGAEYEKREFGPVPRGIEAAMASLESDGVLRMWDRQMPDLTVQKRAIPQRAAKLAAFSSDEVSIIHEVSAWLEHLSAAEVSELSHDHVGWEVARMGETIPLSTALIRTQFEVSPEVRGAAQELASKLASDAA